MKFLSKIVESGSYSVCTALAALALGAEEPASAQANVEECGTDLPLSGTTSGGGQSMVYRSAEHRMGPLGVVVFDPPGDHIAGVLGAVDVPCSP